MKEGKTINYQDPPLESVRDKTCWLCGGGTGGRGAPIKNAIKPTFTDHPYARGQGSSAICSGCAFCLGNKTLRNYSIMASTAGLQHPSRADWREILLVPPDAPFVMCFAVSGQKHLSFKAPVNYSREVFSVALEEQIIEVIPVQYRQCLDAVEALYGYFTKEEISTGRYSQHRIQQCGISRFEQLEEALSPWRKSRLLELVLFVAQRQEATESELKEVYRNAIPTVTTRNENKNIGAAQLGFQW